MQDKTKILLTLLLPVQIIGIQLISFFPKFIEDYYSNGLYLYISRGLRYTFGWIPFSFGDIGYFIFIIFIIRFIYKQFKTKPFSWKKLVIEIGSTLSVVYFMFHILWGLNYYRQPMHKILDIDDTYTEAELIQVAKYFIEKSNQIHQQLQPDDSLAVEIPYTKDEIFDKTIAAYQNLVKKYPFQSYQPASIKKSMLSLPLTYMGFSGYLNPITNEGQVNSLILNYKTPTTTCHEEAHQIGFAKENEANFIGALAALNSDDLYFRYSGVTFALKFCLNDLYRRDEQKAICLIEQNLRHGVRMNYRAVNEFWEAYRNPIEPLFKESYDSYLKANNQPDGMETYSYVSALLVNYFKGKEVLDF
ncbi:DUF3810 domain-containing protein [Aquimarina sp. ERC-38]|uniref:DUF3810 domain-containing protein n=1 Tax=Aquimarina sp. ERC-38 TaxID=2949996 RepID=UPI002246AE52|nr:DUF3810 domain-containing protein [Aquimarina sp. ERC-38]UZO80410.1 DUF3810 domain-containing protein [Aquimarina sp. ERC-38]